MQKKGILCSSGRLWLFPEPNNLRFLMKVSALCLVSFLMVIQIIIASPGYGQKAIDRKVDLTFHNELLPVIFESIQQQAGVIISYENRAINEFGRFSISHNQITVGNALDIIFSKKNLQWKLVDDIIMISSKIADSVSKTEKVGSISVSPLFEDIPPPIEIRGRVVNDKGEAIPGATITIKGDKKATSTDADGNFSLKGVDEDAVMIVTGANIETYEAKVKGQRVFNFTVQQKLSPLDQIQIIAYGTSTKRLSTGSVSTVKAAEIEKNPVTNVLQAIQGRVPGLMIEQTTGAPGGSITVKIRGQNSISTLGKTGDPLFVVDGLPYNSQLPQQSLNAALGFGTTLDFINPKDIESIDVLKDADATSIYGSRAANGVILITTKKAKAGAMKLDVDIYSGMTKTKRLTEMMNTQQYLTMRKEAFENDNLTPGAADFDVNGVWDTTRYTNWAKELEQRPAHFTNAQLSLSGGNEINKFQVRGGFSRQGTGFPRLVDGDGANQTASLQFNLNSISKNKRFQLDLTGSYINGKNTVPTSIQSLIQGIAPDAPALYNIDGTLNWAPLSPGQPGTFNNPLAQFYNQYKALTSNLISSAVLSYKIAENLEFKSNVGYNEIRNNQSLLSPTSTFDPGYGSTTGSAYFQNSTLRSWNIEPQLNYKTSIVNGSLTALIGATFQQNENESQALYATNFANDALLASIQNAGSVSKAGGANTQYKYAAVFGRINYNLKDKYLLNINLRKDGSSRFGPGKQFHTFASLGGAYIFTQNQFFKNDLNFLSFGKLRSSYGTSGSDGFSDYQFLDLYNILNTAISYQGISGLAPQNQFNPDLAWEETRKFDIGLELGFLNDRIIIEGNFYNNRSGNQLVTSPLSTVTGFTSIVRNLPALVENSGFEFTLSTTNIKARDFSWTTSFNISINRNKLVDFPGLEQTVYKDFYVVGKPVNIIKIFNYAGVNNSTGLYQFKDSSGNLTSFPNSSTDKTELINTAPKYFGGFQNTFNYKDFSLTCLFQFVHQIGQNINGAYPVYPGQANTNMPAIFFDRWQKPGDQTEYQKYSTGYSFYAPYIYATQSAWAYSNASFVRLKNLSFNWRLPMKWQQSVRLKNASIYLQGQNLLTISDYKGADPETKALALPPTKIWTFGIKASF
jgi:TonB-dependent starch-binding outer membrane protein SusC